MMKSTSTCFFLLVIHVFTLLPFIAFQQEVTLEQINDDSYFNHYSMRYDSREDIKFYRESGKVGLDVTTDSLNSIIFAKRFYDSGLLSMIITNVNFSIKATDSVFLYCVAGNVRTYYKNGQLRSRYSINKNKCHEDTVEYFSRLNGKNHLTNIKKNGKLMNGFYLDRGDFTFGNQKDEVILIYVEQGKVEKVFFITSDKTVYRLVRGETRKKVLFNKLWFNKFKNTFNLFSDEALYNSSHTIFPNVQSMPYFQE